ncbi:TetR/AcrR family transcriptional regulator [Alkaliphilus transvaalensis]|uniref:TetR/AcrR family transcriptional regulator n=1 Tax=Alkaliphilus transvaalensis TaxID=114628 RepID=UPI00047BB719|nr:TetR/AcrR family transcriptional regulator [Alkaliphilus transvaalensis]
MAPKKKFSKEAIINTGFEIAKIEGINSITIRKVAEKLGSSIAPIYVNFNNIDELIEEVIKKVYQISHQIYLEENTGSPFRDIGVASLRFAKEYSLLFKDMMMNSNQYMKNYDEDMGEFLIEEMRKDPELADFSDMELQTILLKMRIFQTGLSVMVANNLLPQNITENYIKRLLDDTARDIVYSTASKIK